MTVERLYGPPGTGKTTQLTREIQAEAAARGVDELLIGSFSVTAAEVLAGRNKLPKGQVGTLHRHAYAAIGHVPVANDPKVIGDWNATERSEWHINPDGRRSGPPVERDEDDEDAPINTAGVEIANAHTGDQLITALDYLRSTLTPPEDWPPNVVAFSERWEAWKAAAGAVDYSDMILKALERAREGERAPGNPSVLVCDEAQDLTPSEVALWLRWARNGDARMIFGLDDDQAIMNFRGANPETLIGLGADPTLTPDDDLWVDPETLSDRVLDQSWRVPGAAHAVAEKWVRKLSMRRDKLYRARLADPERFGGGDDGVGTARLIGETLTDPRLIDRVEGHIGAGRTVALLTSCNFHLASVIKELRRRGIPFHNQLRPAEPRWNPLGPTAGISTPQRLFRYLVMDDRELGERSRLWTGEDVAAWIDLVDTKRAGLARGAKATAKRFGAGTLGPDEVAALFADGEDSEHFAAAVEPSIEWLSSVLLDSKAKAGPMTYALAVARNAGAASLVDTPMVSVGTTHSYKGGEADVVMVSPDMSGAAAKQLHRPGGKDSVIRLMYVALTRGLRDLELMAPSSRFYIQPRDLLPTSLEVLG